MSRLGPEHALKQVGTVSGLKFGVACLPGPMSTGDVKATRLVLICINLGGGKP